MILNLFIVLLSITLLFIGFGRFFSSPPLEVVGYGFLFMLGVTLMLGGVNYPSGEIETVLDVATYNGTVVGVNVERNTTYTGYSGEVVAGVQLHHFYGLFIALSAAFAFIVWLIDFRGWASREE